MSLHGFGWVLMVSMSGCVWLSEWVWMPLNLAQRRRWYASYDVRALAITFRRLLPYLIWSEREAVNLKVGSSSLPGSVPLLNTERGQERVARTAEYASSTILPCIQLRRVSEWVYIYTFCELQSSILKSPVNSNCRKPIDLYLYLESRSSRSVS